MYISFSSLKHPIVEKFNHVIELTQTPVIQHIFGISNKIFDKQWALTADSTQHARVFSFKVKPHIKHQEITLEDPQYEVVLKSSNYLVINKNKKQTSISQQDIKRLLQQIGDSTKLGMSYILNGFTSQESYFNSKLSQKFNEGEVKISAAQQVTREYFNKQLRGKELYQIPKYLSQTGNWSDTESNTIKIKGSEGVK